MIRLKPNRALLVLSLLGLSSPALALQVVDARDGETAVAKISQKEVTRIVFEKSRVRRVTGNAGEFVLEKDEDKGQVFIRPTSAENAMPINLFIMSDRGTVGLLLQPVDMPTDTIVIREGREPAPRESRTERSGRHVRTIKNLLLAMATDALPDDMEIREVGQELALWPGVRLVLQRSYMGAGFVGERYSLANITTATVSLTERDLYKRGVMAVSLERATLTAGESTNLFVIRERGND